MAEERKIGEEKKEWERQKKDWEELNDQIIIV